MTGSVKALRKAAVTSLTFVAFTAISLSGCGGGAEEPKKVAVPTGPAQPEPGAKVLEPPKIPIGGGMLPGKTAPKAKTKAKK